MLNYTNIDQSNHLKELGLNPETADFVYMFLGCSMYFQKDTNTNCIFKLRTKYDARASRDKDNIPCWSVGALMKIIPKKNDSTPALYYGDYSGEDFINKWFCSCGENCCGGDSPLDACYNLVVYLLENGYLK